MKNLAQAPWRLRSPSRLATARATEWRRRFRPQLEALESRCLLAIMLTGGLADDTAPGGTNADTITFDPTIAGMLSDVNPITSFKAGVNANPVTTDALPLVQPGGSFTLSGSFLATANGGALPDGAYVLHLQAQNSLSQTASLNINFTLDTTGPTVTALTAAPFTQDTTPHVTVTATDANGIPDGTQVNLDVDTNDNGNFSDPGELNRTTWSLYSGTNVFQLTPALPATNAGQPYSVQLRARVTDVAGNVGTSAVEELKVDTIGTSYLQDYVNAPDASYSYTLNKTISGSGYTAYIYDMISQTWRTTADVDKPVWHHWLQVIVPTGTVSTTALLLVDGGNNSATPPSSINSSLATAAVALHSVVVDLPEVPNQPLVFTGDPSHLSRTEDQILSYTFSQFEATGDPTWPALLPMVKSAVRAMDTTQSVVPGIVGGGAHIDNFVVTGYSKRGWTTWLTAAVDSRVSAIIPGVFDALNLGEQMMHHYGFYSGIPAGPTFDNGFSIAIQDYVGYGIPEDVQSIAGQALGKIVDPYAYLTNGRFTIPKLDIDSTGDEFFIPDSAEYYYSDLPGTENYLRYIPNTGHPLNTTDTANSTASFYNAIINNLPLPQFSWSVQPDGSIHVQTTTTPTNVVMWQATNPTYRDFRYNYNSSTTPVYTSSTLTDLGGGLYVASVPTPATGATAFFVQLTFPSPLSGNPYIFTTEIKVVSKTPLGTYPAVDLNGPASGLNFTTNWLGAGAVNIANSTSALVTDSVNPTHMTVAIVGTHSGDTLTANTTGTSITASFVGGTLSLSGSDTPAHYQSVLRTVKYNNTSGGPGVAAVTLKVIAGDAMIPASYETDTTININTPPVVDLDTLSGGINYTVSTSASLVTGIAIANGANSSVTDADSPNLASLTAAIVGTHAGDTLTANTSGTSISASYASGTLSLTGSDTPAHYQTVLQTIKYGSSGAPGVDTITIDVTANDGSLNSTTAVTTINLTPAIDLDTVASGTGFTTGWYNSGTNAGGQVPISNMTNATVTSRGGANLTGMTITLTSFHTGDVLALATLPNALGLNISQSYSSGTLSLTGSDTAAHYQEALRFVSYNNTTGTGPGVASVTANVVATDGVLSSNTAAATININNGQSGGGQVLGNRLFYNNSKYDGNNTAINGASDDAAIATDKIGYLQGTATAATYASVSNFFRGITGVMVDLQSGLGTHSNINLTSNDISFKFISAAAANASVVNNVGAWGTANSPVAISTRIGAGTGGSDRIEITWNNGSIKQGWLEVDVKANANTGLTNPDIFFFGSLIGDSSVGDSAAAASTNTNDVTPPRNNLIGLTTPVWNLLDYTRDGQVNTNDPTQAANNPATLRYPTNPIGPYAPDAGGGVASGLTAGASTASSGSSTTAPAWLVSRLQSAGDLNTGDIAVYFQQLAAADTPDDQAILLEADQAASDLGLNDDLVESLLADLGLV